MWRLCWIVPLCGRRSIWCLWGCSEGVFRNVIAARSDVGQVLRWDFAWQMWRFRLMWDLCCAWCFQFFFELLAYSFLQVLTALVFLTFVVPDGVFRRVL